LTHTKITFQFCICPMLIACNFNNCIYSLKCWNFVTRINFTTKSLFLGFFNITPEKYYVILPFLYHKKELIIPKEVDASELLKHTFSISFPWFLDSDIKFEVNIDCGLWSYRGRWPMRTEKKGRKALKRVTSDEGPNQGWLSRNFLCRLSAE
jgi:hypothetical protein